MSAPPPPSDMTVVVIWRTTRYCNHVLRLSSAFYLFLEAWMQRQSVILFRRGLAVSAQHSPPSTWDAYVANPGTAIDIDNALPDLDESQLNNTLHSLALTGQFSAAERLRLKIVSNGFDIHPRPEYARVALACLRNRRLSGASGYKLNEYLTWVDLVSDRESLLPAPAPAPSPSPISSLLLPSSPFDQIVHEITHRVAQPKFRPFLSHTASAVASKGFAKHHLLTLARPIILASPHTSPCVASLSQMEELAAQYEQLHGRPSTPIAAYIRCSLIHLFAQRGWLWKSIDLILSDREYTLPDHVYKTVMDGIHGTTRLSQKAVLILRKWDKDKTQRLLELGMTR